MSRNKKISFGLLAVVAVVASIAFLIQEKPPVQTEMIKTISYESLVN